MTLSQVTVAEIVKQAVNGDVNIPEFQRNFVWDPEKVKRLAESLYRNYPIGSFLMWDSSEYSEPRTAQGFPRPIWIVDGQQRITALCLLLGQKPYWWESTEDWNRALERYDVMVNILSEEDDRLEFALPNPVRRKDPRWVSIREVLSTGNVENLTSLAQQITTSIKGQFDAELFGKVHARLHQLWRIRERVIPVIEINHEVEDVVEIFARLNQEGTRVKEADVTLAIIAEKNPGWVRDEYRPFRNELERDGWDLEAGIFIRTMTGIGRGQTRLKEVPRDFWNPKNLSTVWRDTKETIVEVLRRLAEYGITSVDLLPSENSLIPFFVIHHRWKDEQGYRFGKTLRWFLRANWDGRYSGSAITSLGEDIRTIRDAGSFDEAIKNLENRLRVGPKIDEREFLGRFDQPKNYFLRLMLYLLIFRRGARDWVRRTRIGYDETGARITSGFEPQWHHIYPRSVLKRANIPDDEINCLANITVLNERANLRLGRMLPSQYIRRFQISEQDLRDHLIPETFAKAASDPDLLEKQWSLERYTEFVIERAKLLAEEANKFFQELENAP
jgi:hypothetical protein